MALADPRLLAVALDTIERAGNQDEAMRQNEWDGTWEEFSASLLDAAMRQLDDEQEDDK